MANPALTPSILETLLAGVSRTIARGAGDDPASAETAAALLQAFRPETPVQAMLATQAIALHHAAIDCFGRAMQTAGEDGAGITRLQRNGASLTRAFTATLHTLHRCQVAAAQAAEAEQQDLMQREKTAPPCPPPAPEPSGPQQDGWENPLQRDLPVAPAKAEAQGSPADVEVARFREDDGEASRRLSTVSAQNRIQQTAPGLRSGSESLADQAKPRGEQSPYPRWEDLTEAEQFLLLYPEPAAAPLGMMTSTSA